MKVCDVSSRYLPHGRGYVKVYRKLLSSAVFHDEGTLKVWLWCLLRANYEPVPIDFSGEEINIESGQFVTGRFSAARELNMADSRVYRLLKKLEFWNNISIKSNNKFSVITIVNYRDYQFDESPLEQPANNQRTTSEQPANTDKETKKQRNKECTYTRPKDHEEMIQYFLSLNGCNQDAFAWFDHFQSNGWKVGGKTPMKDWKASARTWMRNKGAFSKTNYPKPEPLSGLAIQMKKQ